MGAVYPRAPEPSPEVFPFNEAACVAQIILMREDSPDTTVANAIGFCLEAAGGTVQDVYRVWDEVEAERISISALPLQDEAKYIESVSSVANHLDPVKWVAGMKAKLGVGEITAPEPESTEL